MTTLAFSRCPLRYSQAIAAVRFFICRALEIGWAIGLKYTEGFTRLLPSLWTIASMILSIVLLGLAPSPRSRICIRTRQFQSYQQST